MWYLQFVPHWIFYGILGIGIFGIIFSRFVPFYYKTAAQAVSYLAFAFGLFMTGAVKGSESLLAEMKDLREKVTVAEEQSVQETVKIETKYVNKTQVIRERGEDVLKYMGTLLRRLSIIRMYQSTHLNLKKFDNNLS